MQIAIQRDRPAGGASQYGQPGPAETALWLGDDGVAATVARAGGGKPEDVAKQAASETVTGRFTRLEEVADLVLLLTSDRAGNDQR